MKTRKSNQICNRKERGVFFTKSDASYLLMALELARNVPTGEQGVGEWHRIRWQSLAGEVKSVFPDIHQ